MPKISFIDNIYKFYCKIYISTQIFFEIYKNELLYQVCYDDNSKVIIQYNE